MQSYAYRNSNKNFKYYMDNKELEKVQEEKDLGVLITNDLKASPECPFKSIKPMCSSM